MLQLTYRSTLKSLMSSPNIAASMSVEDRQAIGQWAKAGYDIDKASRTAWERRMADAMKLALQVSEAKTYPWPNASNIKFPLITVAALNFHARAYPSLIPPSGLVKCGPIGYQPPQELIDRCGRVAGHMSFQIQRRTNWEAETDKALLIVAIMGCGLKKTYYDPVARRRCSDLVLPQNFVIHYQTTDLHTATRYSEFFQYSNNEVRESVLGGYWLEPDQPQVPPTPTPVGPLEAARDQAQGLTQVAMGVPNAGLYDFVESYVWMDLDGDDYDEPYIVTFDLSTGFVRRIVARFQPSDVRYKGGKDSGQVMGISAQRIYTKLPFIPSPDGGFYDLGLGTLLGPLNEAVDSLINMLVDAGTMSNLGGGFLGRGARIKRGATTFVPGEWKQVDSSGADLNANVVPLPVRDPSKALFDLMVYLVGYAERIASANEVQSGEVPDWNMKAEVMKIADANGARIYAAIFKRLWRAIGEEFQAFYLLNRNYPIELDYEASGRWFQVSQQDYMGGQYEIMPAADPNAVTDTQRKEQAAMVFQLAQTVPGHNLAAATKRMYQAHNVPDIKEVFPVDEVPEPPNIELMKVQILAQEAETKRTQIMSSIMEQRLRLQMEAEKVGAQVLELYAKAQKELAEADGVETGHLIAAMQTQVAAAKEHREGILHFVEILTDIIANNKETDSGAKSKGGTNAGATGTGAALGALVGPAGGAALPPLAGMEAAGNAD